MHTPASLRHHYGAESDQTWDRFVHALRALPEDIKVLGINDYLFLDGYRRLVEAKDRGDLPNIDLLLPIIELRLDRFGGSEHRLSRVNMHVMFSDNVSADVIEQQFLAGLVPQYQLTPQYEGSIRWSGVLSRASLVDLGNAIIEAAPAPRRVQYGPPLIEGFNNLNVSQQAVFAALDKPYFKGLYQTAIGKTEWADLRWSDQSIADKRSIINSVDWVFTAADSPSRAIASRDALRDAGVNHRLLDCSDAHSWPDSPDKDRLGNSFTWLQADTEFEGLLQAFREYEARVFIGAEPESRFRVRSNSTKYIAAVAVNKVAEAPLEEPWFDGTSVRLNPELVAVIGNKGSGKSALLDIIALLGDSRRQEHASFLSSDRFRKPGDNKARYFEACLTWETGERGAFRSLDDTVSDTAAERVTYVPQKLFDTICNELEGSERGAFDAELKRVIFSHVSSPSRLGHHTLDELLEYRSTEIDRALDAARRDLSVTNQHIVAHEQYLTSTYRETLTNQLAERQIALQAHEASKPGEVLPPAAEPTPEEREILTQLDGLREEAKALDSEVADAEAKLLTLARKRALLERLSERGAGLQKEVTRFLTETAVDFSTVAVEQSLVLSFTFDPTPLKRALATYSRESLDLTLLLEGVPSKGHGIEAAPSTGAVMPMRTRRRDLQRNIEELTTRLNAAQEAYQQYLLRLSAWNEERAAIVGTADAPGTFAAISAELDRLATLPAALELLLARRREIAQEVHSLLMRKVALYQELYAPVQAFIERHQTIAEEGLQLRVHVTLTDASFENDFFDLVSRQRSGTFAGVEESHERIARMLTYCDFTSASSSIAHAERFVEALKTDLRQNPHRPVLIAAQLRSGKSERDVYDYLFGFEYLEARFGLRLDQRELHQLSPGEKGALLLVFYLLVDQSDNPLLIDQPEENLDNQTVVRLLVPAVREAKKRRQIIMVTHNPNLAVVCDAAQVICATRDTVSGTMLHYHITGAIENPIVNRAIQEVLEGTRLAFTKRGEKYQEYS